MSPPEDPVVAQRRLRNTLRSLRLRPEHRRTQKEVAEALDWSPSKLLRIEGGQVAVATSDLLALLAYYGITDRNEISKLVGLARTSRRRTFHDTYRDVFSREFADFIRYEAYATTIRQYETKLIPGVLQTEEYAEAIIRTYLGKKADERSVSRRVRARFERAKNLFGRPDGGPMMHFILDEAVLRRQAGRESGNEALMRRQLEHLKVLSRKPKIEILVARFEIGLYSAMKGPFELLEFEDPQDETLLYLENPLGDVVIRESFDEIAPYLDMFAELEKAIPDPTGPSFANQIDRILAEM